jgi:hypothetical protein
VREAYEQAVSGIPVAEPPIPESASPARDPGQQERLQSADGDQRVISRPESVSQPVPSRPALPRDARVPIALPAGERPRPAGELAMGGEQHEPVPVAQPTAMPEDVDRQPPVDR